MTPQPKSLYGAIDETLYFLASRTPQPIKWTDGHVCHFAKRSHYTTEQAAKLLEISPSRIRQFVLAGRLPATKIGRDLFIKEQDLKKFQKINRPHERPKTTDC
jgi:excisionase family DNA binding protein